MTLPELCEAAAQRIEARPEEPFTLREESVPRRYLVSYDGKVARVYVRGYLAWTASHPGELREYKRFRESAETSTEFSTSGGSQEHGEEE